MIFKRKIGYLFKLICIYFVIFNCFIVKSQNYSLKNLTVEDGLPSSLITYVFQDNKGYIWFGSDNGIGKYDGYNVERFGVKDGVPLNFITKIIQLRNGNILFTTFSEGFVIYNGEKFKRFFQKQGFPASKIFDCIEEGNDSILFGTDKGVVSYKNNVFLNLTVKHLWPGRVVRSILKGNDGKLFIGTLEGLLIVENNSFKFYKKSNGLVHNRILSLNKDNFGKIWIGTAEGLSIFDGKIFKNYTNKNLLPNNVAFCQSKDNDNFMWVGTQFGAIGINGNSKIQLNENNGLISNYVYSIESDREGNLFFGTQSGASILKNKSIISYTSKHGLFGNSVYAVCVTKDNKVWVSCDKGIGYFYKNKWKLIKEKTGPASGLVYGIAEDLNNNVWFAGELGIFKYKNGIIEDVTKFKALPSVMFTSIFVDEDGVLWFGSRNKGLYSFNGKSWKFYDKYGELLENKITAVYMDKEKTLWVGENSGKVNILKDKLWSIPYLYGLKTNADITGFCEDFNNNFWIATMGDGIYCIENNFLKHYEIENGLIDNKCSFIKVYGKKVIIGTKRGLSVFENGKFFNFNSKDGLASSDINLNAVSIKDNNLWIGTAKGLTKINIDNLKENKTAPITYLTKIKVNGKSIDFNKAKLFPFEKNNFDFNFIGLYFNNVEKVVYKYKLEGADSNFNLSKEKTVSYRSLSPGDYVFKIKAGLMSGVWSKNEIKYEFKIKPPFYKTIPFLIISQIFIIFLGIVLFYYGKIAARIFKDYREKTKFAHFQILKLIDKGGEGEVFEAFDKLNKKKVALKIIDKSMLEEKEAFLQNKLICENIKNNGIVEIFERGKFKNKYFISMELIEGISLRELIDNRIISEKSALLIFEKLILILEKLHNENIVHRDLKPENIMIEQVGLQNNLKQCFFENLDDFNLKILDFGLAKYINKEKISKIESGKGTPMFLPPEYFLNKREVSAEIDIYSASVILYIMLTGITPYSHKEDDIYHLISSILYDKPVSPNKINNDISDKTSDFVDKLIDKNVENRLKNIEEIKNQLKILIKR